MRFFNRVTLQTPESVELEFTLAGIGNRALALLLDYTALSLTLLVFWIVWIVVSLQPINALDNVNNIGTWLIAIALLLNFLIYTGYFVLFEVIWQGQTPGKRYAKIRVIRDDGRRIGIQQAALRALLRPIDDILFIGAFLIMFNSKEKRLGDMVGGTIVIQEEYTVGAANFPISPQAEQLAKQLPALADLSLLLPDDFATIREYLRRREGMIHNAKFDLSQKIANQIKNIINLKDWPEDVTPDEFLEAVYIVYQQQSTNT